MMFHDRIHAARLLVEKLEDQKGKHPLVLAIPRGAVPMARVIAEGLGGDLDVVLVHKFGFPENPEFALGSVTEEGAIYPGIGAERSGVSEKSMECFAHEEIRKLKLKREMYTPHHQPKDVAGRLAIIVDDGIATGATMTAAVKALQSRGAARIIVATPVASPEAVRRLVCEGAEVRALDIPTGFMSVGDFFEDFSQVSDDEVIRTLRNEDVRA